MEPSFRSQYESRGRLLKLRGTPVEKLSREELIAVIGFMFEKFSSGEQRDLPASAERELDWEDPPPNDGLFEG